MNFAIQASFFLALSANAIAQTPQPAALPSEQEVNAIAERVKTIYQAEFAQQSLQLQILIDEKNRKALPHVNPEFNTATEKRVWLPRKMLSYQIMNHEFYVINLCHETGHYLGGAPASSYAISYEGQADYWSARCMMRYFQDYQSLFQTEVAGSSAAHTLCSEFKDQAERTACVRTLDTAERWFGLLYRIYGEDYEINPDKRPLLSKKSTEKADGTLDTHPRFQCRVDTIVAAVKGQERPACWYLAPASQK